MEPHRFTGTEAERWLLIAEKLLTTRDLTGSKTFAIRARDTDPSLQSANKIIAVVDTLLAGEKRINNQRDWYAVLQLVDQTDDSELIAGHYKRLALLLNPFEQKIAFADEAFKLVAEAWSVLSNPPMKFLYDSELNLLSNHAPVPPPPDLADRLNPKQHENVTSFTETEKNDDDDDDATDESELDSSFWTACPYCYTMYEYPRVYEDCTLRCQNCRKAFQAVMVRSPPPVTDGIEGRFCCWGFFPLAVSVTNQEKNEDGVHKWTPFSPINSSYQFGDSGNNDQQNVNVNVAAAKPKTVNARKSSTPRNYMDAQDVFEEITELADGSDDEWDSARENKRKKVKNSPGKNVGKSHMGKGKIDILGGAANFQGGFAVPIAKNTETNKKVVANNSRKQTSRVANELGKLDLNVEFSNEAEEIVTGINVRTRTGNREEDGFEGTGFFEGLDEFLSSLPILSVVGGDKVKAT